MTLLALVFASAGASARTDVDAKPHVGAIDVAAAICIEVHGLASAEEHQGILRLATTETSDVPDAARGGATAAQLLRPAGMTNAQFGKLIGWTRGGDLAGNLAKTQELIAGLPGRVQALSQAGVTREMAQQWANFYRNVATQNPANPNALARSQLMEALGKLLP